MAVATAALTANHANPVDPIKKTSIAPHPSRSSSLRGQKILIGEKFGLELKLWPRSKNRSSFPECSESKNYMADLSRNAV